MEVGPLRISIYFKTRALLRILGRLEIRSPQPALNYLNGKSNLWVCQIYNRLENLDDLYRSAVQSCGAM